MISKGIMGLNRENDNDKPVAGEHISVSELESMIPVLLGSGGERYRGTIEEYLNHIEQLIHQLSPEADTSWIQARRNAEHCALPYRTEPYDFLAINVPSTYEQGAIPTKEEPPIGLLRVVAAANEAGIRAGSLDAHALNMGIDDIRAQLERIQPSLVGINPTSVNVAEGKTLAELCDEMNIPYVLGGIHATLDPSIAQRDFPTAYAIIKGDGELAIGDVFARLAGQDEAGHEGVYYQGNDLALQLLHSYAPKMPIEEVPFFRQEDYVQFPLVEQIITINGERHRVIEASLYCTRGCPFDCGFCASPAMVGRGVKGIRPYDHPGMDRVVDEVEHMVGLGATAIHFLDDMVIVQPNDVSEFHQLISERGLLGKFVWRGMTRAPVIAKDSFSGATLASLRDSGCWRMTLGVESGNDEILKFIKKQITTDQVEIALQKLTNAGIETKCFFILGFPTETWDQMIDTYNFVMKLKGMGLGSISLFQFKPYPGTALWNKVMNDNPDAIQHLDYVGGDARNIVGGGRAIQGVYLPDDLYIANGVSSGQVRELVQQTLNDFFSTL